MALHPELRIARRGDHYIDAKALAPDLRRIAAKHTAGRFRRPATWSRPSFWGDRGRLTEGDLIRMIELETAEEERLRALYEAASSAAREERAAAEARFFSRLDDESQVLVSIYLAHVCGSQAAAHATHAPLGEAEPCPRQRGATAFSAEAREERRRAQEAEERKVPGPVLAGPLEEGEPRFDFHRQSLDLSLPKPEMRTTLFGNPDLENYKGQLEARSTLNATITSYYQAEAATERARQETEKAFLERNPRLQIHAYDLSRAIVLAKEAFEDAQVQATQAREARRHAAWVAEIDRELSHTAAEVEKAKARFELAEAQAAAEVADDIAALGAATLRADARRALQRKLGEAQAAGDAGILDDLATDAPPAVLAVLKQERELGETRKWAKARRRDLLDKVGGDESKLSEAEREELNRVDQTEADALANLKEAQAAGIIYPYFGKERDEQE